jgi:hypothetical protein
VKTPPLAKTPVAHVAIPVFPEADRFTAEQPGTTEAETPLPVMNATLPLGAAPLPDPGIVAVSVIPLGPPGFADEVSVVEVAAGVMVKGRVAGLGLVT